MNVEEYLNRIGITIEPSVTKDFLFRLHKHHLLNVPFENLDVHYDVPIRLSPTQLYLKIVKKGRGGFCYELNGLFHLLLTSLGFKAQLISCRVYEENNKYSSEFDHMAILVHLENKIFLADVGFGDFIMQPLPLTYDTKIEEPNALCFFVKHSHEYTRLSRWKNCKLYPEYIFKSNPRNLEDFLEMCMYHQTSTKSHMSKNRMISIATHNGRITLTDSFLTITSGSEKFKEKINKEDFEFYLLKYFDIDL